MTFTKGDAVKIVGNAYEAEVTIARIIQDADAHPIYVEGDDGRVFYARNILWVERA